MHCNRPRRSSARTKVIDAPGKRREQSSTKLKKNKTFLQQIRKRLKPQRQQRRNCTLDARRGKGADKNESPSGEGRLIKNNHSKGNERCVWRTCTRKPADRWGGGQERDRGKNLSARGAEARYKKEIREEVNREPRGRGKRRGCRRRLALPARASLVPREPPSRRRLLLSYFPSALPPRLFTLRRHHRLQLIR